jgi:hypothetical protein
VLTAALSSRFRAGGASVLVFASAVVAGCGGSAGALRAPPAPTDRPSTSPPLRIPAGATAAPSTPLLSVAVRPFHEPGDFAHRNYCGSGATEVLLSAWMTRLPDLETVAQRAHLDPRSGQTGADTTAGINSFLDPIVTPALGRSWYRPDHVTGIAALQTRLRADLDSTQARLLFGHAVPVMVQTMTKTMPGWNSWQATHMITISGADLGHPDPALDTVTYAETPSPLAGYRGPDFQTMTVAALWQAMQAFLTADPSDPVNVIW